MKNRERFVAAKPTNCLRAELPDWKHVKTGPDPLAGTTMLWERTLPDHFRFGP